MKYYEFIKTKNKRKIIFKKIVVCACLFPVETK